jgi:dTMP kinase
LAAEEIKRLVDALTETSTPTMRDLRTKTVDRGAGRRLSWSELEIGHDDGAGPSSSTPTRSPIVAIVGLDGAGKSSVCEHFRRAGIAGGGVVTAKTKRDNVNSVEKLIRAPSSGKYMTGNFARAIRWAHTFDFMRYYVDEVKPQLDEGRTVLSDRWSICSITYGEAGARLGEEIAALLECVPNPALTIFLDVDPNQAVQRIAQRGQAHENEDFDVLAACYRAYLNWLERLPGPYMKIENTLLERTCHEVAKAIEATLQDRR